MTRPAVELSYKRNFLKEVIARVDLLNPLQGMDVALPPALSELAVQGFPIAEPREGVERAVQVSAIGIASSEAKFKQWQFHAKDRTKTLTIGQQTIFVQYTKYQTYELVKGDFVRILDRIAEMFQSVQFSRLGLRYVNVIEIAESNPTDWSAYLAPELLSLFNFPPDADRDALSRVFHNLELALETFSLRYRLGMNNPDYPARIRQKVFVLDLDAYTHATADIKSVGPLLDEFHRTIQHYFELSIKNPLRDKMNAD